MSETPSSPAPEPLPPEPLPQEIAAARARLAPYWIHSPPLFVATAAGDEPSQLCFLEPALADRVILLHFWQTTSLLARAQAATVARWQAAYGVHGFLAIGVHTPEFEFARERAHVLAEAAALGLRYPIALDQDGAMAGALGVERWPQLVLLDRQGEVVFEKWPADGADERRTAGEAEAAIRAALLAGRPGTTLPEGTVAAAPRVESGSAGDPGPKPEVVAPSVPVSPDLACGFLRGNLGNRDSRLDATGGVVDCPAENRRASDVIYLAGRWRATRESWVAVPAPGFPSRLLVRCRAGEVHTILGRDEPSPATVTVLLAGKPVPLAMHGRDLTLAPDPGAGEASRTRPVTTPGLLHLVTTPETGPLEIELVIAERRVHVYGVRFAPHRGAPRLLPPPPQQ